LTAAVTGADQSILSKRSFPLRIAIPPEAKRAGITDHIEEMIPLAGRVYSGAVLRTGSKVKLREAWRAAD